MALTEWTIEVDDRERASGVVDALAAYPQVIVAIGRLPLGDYLPGGGVIVERKSATDLVLSIRDQRLFDQAARLAAGTARPVLILEGDPLAVRTGMHKNAILGALTWLTTIRGHPAPAEHRAGAHGRTPRHPGPPAAAGVARADRPG